MSAGSPVEPLLDDPPQMAAWTGSFTSTLLENEFRLATHDEWARRVSAVALLASPLICGFAYVDFRVLGFGPELYVMWGARLLLVAIGLGIAWRLRQPAMPEMLDHAAVALSLAITMVVLLVAGIHRKSVMFEVPATLLCVLSFYLFIPTRLPLQAACAGLLGFGFIAAHAVWGSSPEIALVSAATQMLGGNVLGAYTSRRNHMLLRREFLALRQARRMAAQETSRKEELQRSVAALERSNAELEQFASVASHDLQAPLRTIVSFAQLLHKDFMAPLGEKGAKYLEAVVNGASHMQRLITDLLAFARVGRGGTTFTRVDLQQVLVQVEQQLAVQIRDTQAEVTHGELPCVPGTPTELMQLLQNLLDNALKFQAPGNIPRIHVSGQRRHAGWEIAVRDNGIGIAPDYRERIFEMFHRLNEADRYGGTGIGLAICKKVVQNHHGEVWATSADGGGSTFHFTLPSGYSQAFPPLA